MSSYDNHQALAGLTLGKSTDYRDTYDASLLQGVPRSLNRDPLGLHADNLPFHGADIWTLYELSWLNGKGLPQVVKVGGELKEGEREKRKRMSGTKREKGENSEKKPFFTRRKKNNP